MAVATRMENLGYYLEALHVADNGGVILVFNPEKREYICWRCNIDAETHSGVYGNYASVSANYQQRVADTMPRPRITNLW